MSEMTDERAAEVLAAHNEWRRYDGETGEPGAPEMGDPTELGRAIDHAVSRLRSQPPAEAQPVAFDRRFADMLIGILGDVQDELGFTDEDKLCANGSAEIVAAIRELKERAAPPPSAPVGVLWDIESVEDDPNTLVVNTPDRKAWIAQRGDRVFELASALHLAQQPAAVDGASPYPDPRNRREAAALARLALAYLGATSAHIEAAVARCETDLAAQQGGAE